jgi:hypothetical protein
MIKSRIVRDNKGKLYFRLYRVQWSSRKSSRENRKTFKIKIKIKNFSERGIKMKELEGFYNKVVHGNCLEVLKKLPCDCIDCIITSPPYY